MIQSNKIIEICKILSLIVLITLPVLYCNNAITKHRPFPQLIHANMQDTIIDSFSTLGEKLYTLSADSIATQDNMLQLEKIRIITKNWQISANNGVLDNNTQILQLKNNVTGTFIHNHNGLHAKTHAMTIDLNTKHAFSKERIYFDTAFGNTESQGFEIDLINDNITKLNNITGIIQNEYKF